MLVNLEDLKHLAEQFAQKIDGYEQPLILLLSGDMGSGKTTFTQLLCKTLGVTEDITSPTFIIQSEYKTADRNIFHLDLYRLETVNEFNELKIENLVKDNNLIIIEWPEKFATQIDTLDCKKAHMNLKHASDDARAIIYDFNL